MADQDQTADQSHEELIALVDKLRRLAAASSFMTDTRNLTADRFTEPGARQTTRSVLLPTYEEAIVSVQEGMASALERFIYKNEPAGRCDDEWRSALADVIREAIANA